MTTAGVFGETVRGRKIVSAGTSDSSVPSAPGGAPCQSGTVWPSTSPAGDCSRSARAINAADVMAIHYDIWESLPRPRDRVHADCRPTLGNIPGRSEDCTGHIINCAVARLRERPFEPER